MKKTRTKYPPGWNEARIRRVIEHYDSQTEDEEAAEIERALIADADHPTLGKNLLRHPPAKRRAPSGTAEVKDQPRSEEDV